MDEEKPESTQEGGTLAPGAVIAERLLLCAPAGAPARQVTLRIMAPMPATDGWICEAELANLFRDRASARGVDSLQALQLVLGAVHEALESMIRDGGRVAWADGSPFLSVDDLRR